MGRASTAPSVTETASEGDALMAVIMEGKVDGNDADGPMAMTKTNFA